MSSTTTVGNEASQEQPVENERSDEDELADGPKLRPSVEQEIHAKVDTHHPDAGAAGLTLEAEERLQAREWEIERTHTRWDRGQESDREARCRQTATRVSVERRRVFARRAASVNPLVAPDAPDPREQLSRAELGAVNREARRMAGTLEGWSRAAISRRVAERVCAGADVPTEVVGVFEEFQQAPGQVVPIGVLEAVDDHEVSIQGEITTLWEPSHPKIRQVGLIEDETGRTRFTAWKRSGKPAVREGEQVVFRDVAKSWYEGRCSVALVGKTQVSFPERDRWCER